MPDCLLHRPAPGRIRGEAPLLPDEYAHAHPLALASCFALPPPSLESCALQLIFSLTITESEDQRGHEKRALPYFALFASLVRGDIFHRCLQILRIDGKFKLRNLSQVITGFAFIRGFISNIRPWLGFVANQETFSCPGQSDSARSRLYPVHSPGSDSQAINKEPELSTNSVCRQTTSIDGVQDA